MPCRVSAKFSGPSLRPRAMTKAALRQPSLSSPTPDAPPSPRAPRPRGRPCASMERPSTCSSPRSVSAGAFPRSAPLLVAALPVLTRSARTRFPQPLRKLGSDAAKRCPEAAVPWGMALRFGTLPRPRESSGAGLSPHHPSSAAPPLGRCRSSSALAPGGACGRVSGYPLGGTASPVYGGNRSPGSTSPAYGSAGLSGGRCYGGASMRASSGMHRYAPY